MAGGEPLGSAPLGGDYFVPNAGLRLNPDGTSAFDFEGHVHAQGLDLDAELDAAPSTARRVRWLRENDGSLAADIVGSTDKFAHLTGSISAYSYAPPGSASSWDIFAQAADRTDSYGVQAVRIGDNTGHVLVAARGAGTKLLDAAGASDYAQVAQTQVLWAGPFNPKPANVAQAFTTTVPGNHTLLVSVSGVVSTTGFVKLVWSIDGVQVAFPALIFNVINQHMTFPMALGSVFLPAGSHSWTWTQVNDGGPPVTVNAGDSMHVLLIPSS